MSIAVFKKKENGLYVPQKPRTLSMTPKDVTSYMSFMVFSSTIPTNVTWNNLYATSWNRAMSEDPVVIMTSHFSKKTRLSLSLIVLTISNIMSANLTMVRDDRANMEKPPMKLANRTLINRRIFSS